MKLFQTIAIAKAIHAIGAQLACFVLGAKPFADAHAFGGSRPRGLMFLAVSARVRSCRGSFPRVARSALAESSEGVSAGWTRPTAVLRSQSSCTTNFSSRASFASTLPNFIGVGAVCACLTRFSTAAVFSLWTKCAVPVVYQPVDVAKFTSRTIIAL